MRPIGAFGRQDSRAEVPLKYLFVSPPFPCFSTRADLLVNIDSWPFFASISVLETFAGEYFYFQLATIGLLTSQYLRHTHRPLGHSIT